MATGNPGGVFVDAAYPRGYQRLDARESLRRGARRAHYARANAPVPHPNVACSYQYARNDR